MNKKCSRFLPSLHRAEILTIFCSYFGRNDDFINLFWNLLTFTYSITISGETQKSLKMSMLLHEKIHPIARRSAQRNLFPSISGANWTSSPDIKVSTHRLLLFFHQVYQNQTKYLHCKRTDSFTHHIPVMVLTCKN